MKTIEVETWEGVKEAFLKVEQERSSIQASTEFPTSSSKFLYRGQSNSEWSMQTTLERVRSKPTSVTEYYRHLLTTRPQIEAFSNSRWDDLMELNKYTEWAESRSDLEWPEYPGYEYMIYLRHHGFPSPLMDWTMSPYVAAYFAYTNIPESSNNVAIYCYCEHVGLGKTWSGGEPLITVKGPYARSHKRHFMQQCKYTICAKNIDGNLYYVGHDEVFKHDKPSQDLLWKIVVPKATAKAALKDLDSMNVNALSLMGSEDSLIQTLAARLYVFGGA